jgi:hypothetical protein
MIAAEWKPVVTGEVGVRFAVNRRLALRLLNESDLRLIRCDTVFDDLPRFKIPKMEIYQSKAAECIARDDAMRLALDKAADVIKTESIIYRSVAGQCKSANRKLNLDLVGNNRNFMQAWSIDHIGVMMIITMSNVAILQNVGVRAQDLTTKGKLSLRYREPDEKETAEMQ